MEFLLSVLLAAQLQKPIPANEPPPAGQRIEAKDGDTIVTGIGATLRVVRHANGNVRVVYSAAERWVILLLDHTGSGGTPDGVVDASYSFRDVPSWPLSDQWEGAASLDEYSMAGDPLVGIGLKTPVGFVQLITSLGPLRGDGFTDPSATVVPFSSFGRGGSARLGFDAAEQQQTMMVRRPPPPGRATAPPASYGPVPAAPVTGEYPPPQAPVRVGGNIAIPHKITDVRPAQGNVRGVVTVEIVIGADGTVIDAKILRSIPPLDRAALDTVRQWRYEVTQLNGRPVPVIMTVTVAFQ